MKILVFLLVFIGAGNGLRFYEAINFWNILKENNLVPLYIAMSGGFWLLIALTISIGLWLGKSWAWVATLIAEIGYALWYWINRLVFEFPYANWQFTIAYTLIILGFSTLLLLNPKLKKFLAAKKKL